MLTKTIPPTVSHTHTPRHTLTVDGLIILCGQSIQHCHVYTFCMITALVGGFKCNYVLNTCCQFRAMEPKATHLCYVCNPLRLPRPRSLQTESEIDKHRHRPSCYPIIPTNIKRSAGKPAFPLAATGFARVFASVGRKLVYMRVASLRLAVFVTRRA